MFPRNSCAKRMPITGAIVDKCQGLKHESRPFPCVWHQGLWKAIKRPASPFPESSLLLLYQNHTTTKCEFTVPLKMHLELLFHPRGLHGSRIVFLRGQLHDGRDKFRFITYGVTVWKPEWLHQRNFKISHFDKGIFNLVHGAIGCRWIVALGVLVPSKWCLATWCKEWASPFKPLLTKRNPAQSRS